MPEYLTASQVAELTGYSVDTVRAKFADGSLPAHRIGGRGHWRALEPEIRAAIEGRPHSRATAGVDIRQSIRRALDKAAIQVARRAKAAQGTG